MRLALSNLAWDVTEDARVAALLTRFAIDAIDIAPGKYFPNPEQATPAAMEAVRQWWADRNITITGMQALLFGTTGLNLFGPPPLQQAMLQRLEAVCRIGAAVNAPRLVFGAPKCRDRLDLDDATALSRAVEFFRRLGDLAAGRGVIICLEPNPREYGANFMTTSAEAGKVVAAVNHPAIRLQIDTGAAVMNGEILEEVLTTWAPWVGHVHASEPHLRPLGDDDTDHGKMHQALQRHLPEHVVTIEMLAPPAEPHVDAITRALATAVRYYRPEDPQGLGTLPVPLPH